MKKAALYYIPFTWGSPAPLLLIYSKTKGITRLAVKKMIDYERILKVHDSRGNLSGVMIPADIWAEIENLLSARSVRTPEAREDLSGFKDLMQAWNFRYPYDPAVKCPQCGRHTLDWRKDEPGLFNLVSANLGGLLVFHCVGCGSTVRHKYFKDHMIVESSSSGDHD